MKFFLSTLICLFFIGCSAGNNHVGYIPTPESIERERLCNTICSKVAARLKQQKKLIPCGFGGQTSHGVEMLALSFDYPYHISIEFARELLISAAHEFIATVNEDQRIKKYLNNNPFEPKNIQIRIFLPDSDKFSKVDDLQVIVILNGILAYNIHGRSGRLETFHRETYQEAVKKIESQKSVVEDEQLYEDAI